MSSGKRTRRSPITLVALPAVVNAAAVPASIVTPPNTTLVEQEDTAPIVRTRLQRPPSRKLRKRMIKEDDTKREAYKLRRHVVEQYLRQVIGEAPEREGLRDTPARVVKAWEFWGRGYRERPEDLLTVFEDGAENYDQLIVVSNIPIYSHCEHHLAPFFGTCTIAYLPDQRIVGLSKLVRVAQLFACRLQVQERLTQQIADALMEHLKPRAVGVMISCRHLCMESRGVQAVNTITTTQALRGLLLTDPALRAEFSSLERPKAL